MANYTSVGSSPDIIYTQEFRVANGAKYLDYTERENAVAPVPEDENELKRKENRQQDPDLPKNFKGYLGYTDRKAATRMEDDLSESEKGDYPTFTNSSFELTEEQHQQLVENLKTAQKNKAMLWAGVISFSPDFLEKSGLIDPATGKVNQRAIKAAVMNAMPSYLNQEGLNNDETFWWGDIHLNTNHVHVHLSISQLHNTRPTKDNGEPVGLFHTKSIRRLKSGIHGELENQLSRNRMIHLEKAIDEQRKAMLQKIEIASQNHSNSYLQQMLQAIYQSLPEYKDKRRWRASNHSREFKEAHDLTDKLVSHLLQTDLKADYDEFKKTSIEKDEINRSRYGQRIKDTVGPAEKKLRSRLANRIFDELRKAESYKKVGLFESIKGISPEMNSQLIKVEEKQLKQLDPHSLEAQSLKKRLGVRRYFLRQQNIDRKITDLQKIYSRVATSDNGSLSTEYQKLIMLKIERLELQKLSKSQLSNSQLKRLTELNSRFFDVKSITPNDLSKEMVARRRQQLQAELHMLAKLYKDGSPVVELVLPNGVTNLNEAKRHYQTAMAILDTKLKIADNNKKFSSNPARRNEENGPLFELLKKQYYAFDHGTSSRHTVNGNARSRPSKLLRRVSAPDLVNSLSQVISSAKHANRKEIRALHQELDQDDDLERVDRMERER